VNAHTAEEEEEEEEEGGGGGSGWGGGGGGGGSTSVEWRRRWKVSRVIDFNSPPARRRRQHLFHAHLERAAHAVEYPVQHLIWIGQLLLLLIGPCGNCSPRHRMRFNLGSEDLLRVDNVAGNRPGRCCLPRCRMPVTRETRVQTACRRRGGHGQYVFVPTSSCSFSSPPPSPPSSPSPPFSIGGAGSSPATQQGHCEQALDRVGARPTFRVNAHPDARTRLTNSTSVVCLFSMPPLPRAPPAESPPAPSPPPPPGCRVIETSTPPTSNGRKLQLSGHKVAGELEYLYDALSGGRSATVNALSAKVPPRLYEYSPGMIIRAHLPSC